MWQECKLFNLHIPFRQERGERNLKLNSDLSSSILSYKYLRVLLAINWLSATDTEYGGMEVAIDTHITAQLYSFIQEM
jgi:hypothetical protein